MANIKNFFLKNQTTHQTVAKNFSWLFIGEIAGRLLKMVLVLYAARVLGVAGYGAFSYTLSTVYICSFLAESGLGNLITREYANDDSATQYKQILVIVKIISVAISLAVICIVAFLLMKQKGLLLVTLLLGSYILIDSLRDFASAIARGKQKMEIDAIAKTTSLAVTTVVGIVIIFIRPTVTLLSIAYIIGSTTGFIMVFPYLRPLFRGIRKAFDKKIFIDIAKNAFYFCIILFTSSLMINEDTILVGWIKGFHDAGLYSAAQKLIQIISVIPAIIITAMLPVLSRHMSDKNKFEETYSKILHLLIFIALPISVGGALLSHSIILLAFGSSYAGAAPVLAILFFSIISIFPTMFLISTALMVQQSKKMVGINLISNGIHLIAVFFLIKISGIVGAAIATTVVIAIAFILMAMRFLPVRFDHTGESIWKTTIALVLMGLVTTTLAHLHIFVPIIVVAAIVIYIATLTVLKEKLFVEYLALGKKAIGKNPPVIL